MIIETQRMVTAWLTGSVYGVNAKLAALPTGSGDSAPVPIALITNECDNNSVARDRVPTVYPSLTIMMPNDDTAEPNILTSYRAGEVTLAFRYAISKSDTKVGVRNGFYVQRALQQSLGAFLDNANAASRVRNNIQIVSVSQPWRYGMLHTEVGDAVVQAYTIVVFNVRDETP